MALNRVSDREITGGIPMLVQGFEMPKAHAIQAGHFSGKASAGGIPMLVRGLNIHRSTP